MKNSNQKDYEQGDRIITPWGERASVTSVNRDGSVDIRVENDPMPGTVNYPADHVERY